MPVPRSIRAALKRVLGLRESSYVLRAAGNAAATALRRSMMGRTYAAALVASVMGVQERWWARRLLWSERAQHDCFRIDDLVAIAEAFVCGEARATPVFQKTPRC